MFIGYVEIIMNDMYYNSSEVLTMIVIWPVAPFTNMV